MKEWIHNWGTLIIALWGAITGSIAIYLNIRRFRKDRPIFDVRPKFDYRWSGTYPPEIRLIVKVVNVGQRPGTIQRIKIRYVPVGVFQKLKHMIGLSKDHFFHRGEKNHTLNEGETKDYIFSGKYLNNGKELCDIERVLLQDHKKNVWKSKTSFGQQKVRNILYAEELKSDGSEAEEKEYKLELFETPKDFLIVYNDPI